MKKLCLISLICTVAISMSATAHAAWDFDVVDITEHIEDSPLHEFIIYETNPNTFIYRYDPHTSGPDGHLTTVFQQAKTFKTDGSNVYIGEPIYWNDKKYSIVTLSNGNKIIPFTGNTCAMLDPQGKFILEPYYSYMNFNNGRAFITDKRNDNNMWFEIDEAGNIIREFYSESDPNPDIEANENTPQNNISTNTSYESEFNIFYSENWLKGDRTCTIYNKYGTLLTHTPVSIIDYNNGSLCYINNNTHHVIDTAGNILFTVPSSEKRLCSAINYGVSEAVFADAEGIIADGAPFYIEHDYIDASGNSVLPKRYDEAWMVGDGAFVVKDGEKFLLLNAKEYYALVRVNGEFIETDQSAIVRDGRTLIPMRAIIEALGGTAAWSHREQTAYAKINGKTIGFTIGDTHYKIDGEYYPLDVPAQIINDRTMLPVRAIAEALGAEVGWNGYTRVVYISTNN